MKTVEQLHAEHAEQLAELKREHAIGAGMPLPPVRVTVQGSKRAPWVTYKVTTVAQATAVFRTFVDAGQVVNMENAKGRYRYVCPAGERSSERAPVKVESDAAIALRVCRGEGYESATFFFYADTPAGLVRVCVDFDFRAAPVRHMLPKIRQEKDLRGKATRQWFDANPALHGYAMQALSYASGDLGPVKKSGEHVYLFPADDGADCSAFEELFSTLQNMADAFDPRGAA